MPRLLLPLHVALTGSAAQLDVTSALETPAQVSHCKEQPLSPLCALVMQPA